MVPECTIYIKSAPTDTNKELVRWMRQNIPKFKRKPTIKFASASSIKQLKDAGAAGLPACIDDKGKAISGLQEIKGFLVTMTTLEQESAAAAQKVISEARKERLGIFGEDFGGGTKEGFQAAMEQRNKAISARGKPPPNRTQFQRGNQRASDEVERMEHMQNTRVSKQVDLADIPAKPQDAPTKKKLSDDQAEQAIMNAMVEEEFLSQNNTVDIDPFEGLEEIGDDAAEGFAISMLDSNNHNGFDDVTVIGGEMGFAYDPNDVGHDIVSIGASTGALSQTMNNNL